jgi:hypothetical protein
MWSPRTAKSTEQSYDIGVMKVMKRENPANRSQINQPKKIIVYLHMWQVCGARGPVPTIYDFFLSSQ